MRRFCQCNPSAKELHSQQFTGCLLKMWSLCSSTTIFNENDEHWNQTLQYRIPHSFLIWNVLLFILIWYPPKQLPYSHELHDAGWEKSTGNSQETGISKPLQKAQPSARRLWTIRGIIFWRSSLLLLFSFIRYLLALVCLIIF